MHPSEPRSAALGGRFRRSLMNGLLIFLIGVFVARLPTTLAQISGRGSFIDKVNDVYQSIITNYVDDPDLAKVQKGAIDGMLEALDDDYAEYIPEEDAAMFEKEMTGHFSGIGCQIEMRDGWLTVVSPLEDSPAFNAGIMAGDRITRVEDKSTFKLSADECIKLLTGEPDTQVSLTVQRDGQDIPYTLTRAPITSKSVRGIVRKPDGSGRWQFLIDPASKIAYIRLAQFTPTASRELAEALQSAFEQARNAGGDTINGLILDLRNNPGGVMEGALEIADMFLDGGTIMTVRGRNSPAVHFPAQADGTLPNFPVAVLVNEASASASEIVAGALRDHNRAVIVGTRTYGKGLVQTVQHLPHAPKAQVKFTTQRYYLPSGRLIQRTDESTEWGVDPSPGFYIPMTDKEQYEAFLKRRDWDILRKDGDPHNDRDQNWASPDWIREHALDLQLAAAVQAVQTRIADGPSADWRPVSEIKDQHGTLQVAELEDLQEARRLMGIEFARIEKRIAALERQAEIGEKAPERVDLWADTIDLTGGRIEVLDKEGQPIAKLKVTGRDIERWLLNADVEPLLNSAQTPEGERPPAPTEPSPEP